MAQKFQHYEETPDDSVLVCEYYYRGQTFTVETSHTLTAVHIYAHKIDSPVEVVTIEIQPVDVDHKPTGEVLSSGTFNAADLDLTDKWVEVAMSEYDLEAGTEYVIVIKAPALSYAKRVEPRSRSSVPVYPDGFYVYTLNGGSSWSVSANESVLFQEWGDLPTPPAPPSADINPDAFTGYHCFQEQFQKRRGQGKIPYKKPDGTLYRSAPSGS